MVSPALLPHPANYLHKCSSNISQDTLLRHLVWLVLPSTNKAFIWMSCRKFHKTSVSRGGKPYQHFEITLKTCPSFQLHSLLSPTPTSPFHLPPIWWLTDLDLSYQCFITLLLDGKWLKRKTDKCLTNMQGELSAVSPLQTHCYQIPRTLNQFKCKNMGF